MNESKCEGKTRQHNLKNCDFGTDVSGVRQRVLHNMFFQITASADSRKIAVALVNVM